MLSRLNATTLRALPRWLAATMAGTYPGRGRLVLMAAACLYLLSPIDLLPEVILGPLGLVDDLGVFAWIGSSALTQAESFQQWEQRRERSWHV